MLRSVFDPGRSARTKEEEEGKDSLDSIHDT